jgi:hypothetical protein
MISNIAMTQFTSSAVVVWGMQRLKSAKWFPFLQHGQAWVSRAWSLGAAAIVEIGISYTWNKNPDGTHSLILVIPTLAALGYGLWHWVNQFCLQEVLYQATVNKVSLTSTPSDAGHTPKVSGDGKVIIQPTDAKL